MHSQNPLARVELGSACTNHDDLTEQALPTQINWNNGPIVVCGSVWDHADERSLARHIFHHHHHMSLPVRNSRYRHVRSRFGRVCCSITTLARCVSDRQFADRFSNDRTYGSVPAAVHSRLHVFHSIAQQEHGLSSSATGGSTPHSSEERPTGCGA
jgi:hypothetical protein